MISYGKRLGDKLLVLSRSENVGGNLLQNEERAFLDPHKQPPDPSSPLTAGLQSLLLGFPKSP